MTQRKDSSSSEDTSPRLASALSSGLWRTAVVSAIIGAVVGAVMVVTVWSVTGSARRQRLEVRTVPLARLSAPDAVDLLTPYITAEGGAVYRAGSEVKAITIRERRERMDDLVRILREYDHPPASVTLSVMSLVAGERGSLAAELAPLADILMPLAGGSGLRVASSETIIGTEGQIINTRFGTGSGAFLLTVEIVSTLVQDTTLSVRLRVSASRPSDSAPLLRTDITIPLRQSVALGSARTEGADRRPLVLLTPTRIVR